MTLLAVDPGIGGCGVAFFYDSVLRGAWYVRAPKAIVHQSTLQRAGALADIVWHECVLPLSPPDILVVEYPQIYRHGDADPNDLLALSAVGGALSALAIRAGTRQIASVLPRDWKKQIGKNLLAEHVLSRLPPEEQACIPKLAKSYIHNVYDAIGIGLYWQSTSPLYYPRRITP